MTYEEWRKKRNEGASSPWGSTANANYNYWLVQSGKVDVEAIGNQINDRVNTWLKNNQNYVLNANDRFSVENPSYRNDASDWLSTVTTQNSNFQKEADSIKALLDQYKGFFNEEYVASVKYALDGNLKVQGDVISNSTKDLEYWSQWETEDAYKEYVAYQKDYNEKLNYDLEAGRKEIEELEEFVNSYQIDTGKKEDEEWWETLGRYLSGGTADTSIPMAGVSSNISQTQSATNEAYKTSSELLSKKKAYYTQAERVQKAYKLASVADVESENYDSEFESYAQKGLNYTNPSVSDAEKGKTLVNKATYAKEHGDMIGVGEVNGGGSDIVNFYHSFMTDEEIKIYSYYFGKGDYAKADEYLESLEESLQARHGTMMGEQLKGEPVLEYAFGVAAGLDQFTSGVKNMFSDDDYIPTNATQVASGIIREDLADTGATLPDWLGGSSLGQVGYDVVTTTSNMLPSILASVAANYVLPGSGAYVGATLMGASAGGNAKQEMLNLGYSKEQANTYGLMVAIAEGSMEYLLGGISKLGGKVTGNVVSKVLSKIDNAFARTAIKIGGSMASEALEEGLQTVIEPWLKEIATGVDWDDPTIDEVLYSSLLGALSAVGLEGSGTVAGEVNTYRQGSKIRNTNGGVGQLQALATNYFSADTVAYKIASKVDAFTDAYTIGRLLNEVGGTISEQNLTDIVNGLTARGIRESDAKKIARQYQAVLNAEMNMTDEQVKILENLSPLADVLRTNIIGQNTTVYQRTRAYADLMSLADEVSKGKKSKASKTVSAEKSSATEAAPMNIFEQNNINAELKKIASEVATGSRTSASENAIKRSVDSASSVAAEKLGVEGRYTSSETGANRLKSNKQKVNIVGVDSTADGTLKLKLNDGSIVDADEIDFSNSDEALVYEAVANMGVSANTAWEILKGYNPKSGQKGTIYAMGALEAYTYGHNGIKVDGMSKDGFSALLSPTQQNTANRLGDIDARAKVEAKQKTIDKAVKSVRDEAKSKHKAIEKRKGQTVFEGDRARLTDLQESQLNVLEKVAEGLGVTFHIFESKVDANGKRYYKMPNGKITSANGWYDPKTGEIWIDLYAGNDGQGTMIFTAAHELTHFIRQWSPAKFKIFADFLFEQYGKKGQDVNQLIREQMQKAANNGRSITWDEAYEEVIADSCETFLRDSKASEKIAALREKDISLANKIKTFLGQMLAKMRKLMADLGLKPETKEGQMVAEMTDSLQKLYDLWTDALGDAGKAYSTLANIDFDTDSVAPMLSERTWTESEYVTEREETAKKISKALGVDIKTAYKYIDDINSVARLIADDRARLDYEPNLDEHATVLKPNSDYKYSVDMSTLCAKRLLFTGTFDAIQRALPNTVFDSEDIVALREMMQKRGYEVACGICYVESTRREIGRITQEFIDRYKEAQKTGKPITRINSEGKAVDLKKTKDQMETTADKSADKFYAEKDYTPTLADLNTTDIDIVKRDHPLVYEAYLNFMNARGQAKPKLLETRAEYKGEILKHFKYKSAVNARNNAGGLRLQSFSDFEVPHLIDMMQIVMDMSRVGLKSQAYTKVPAFAEIFGDTGVKINLSLIAKGDGLDANGNLVFDDVEGINHNEAFKLRDKYSKNVGTILVGKTDAHIIAAMADSRIDYIIPFHKSSWKESLYDALGLTGYADYTDYQNEKPIDKGREIKNFDPSEYWDFSKSGDENAQIYLAKCREDGRIPKFPQFQGYPGYWKLLIDFKMYDNDGVGSPQEVVRPTFNTEASEKILSEYKGGHRNFPVAKDVVEDFVKEHKDNVKLSDRDSDGNTLSKEQQEFFKDSKVRDSEGRLTPVYHGTPTGGFTEFQLPFYLKSLTSAQGAGFYFTDKANARQYMRGLNGKSVSKKQLYKVYLNITNPLEISEFSTGAISDEAVRRIMARGNYEWGMNHTDIDKILRFDNWDSDRLADMVKVFNGEEILTVMKEELGYDGVHYSDKYGDIWVAWDKTQIKNTTNKTPTSNPDIRYSFRDSKNGMANDALIPYNEEQTRFINQRGDYIIDSFEKLKEVVNLAFDQPDTKAIAHFGMVDAETLQKIKNSIPNLPESMDTLFTDNKGYSIATTLDGIRHIVKEKQLTRQDVIDYLDRFADTIVEYDEVDFHYYTRRGRQMPGLLFRKDFPDGKYVSFDLVSQEKQSLLLQSLYIDSVDYEKRKSANPVLMQNASASTSKTRGGQTSTNMIAQKPNSVNRDTEKNSLRNVEPIETADYVKMYHHFGSTKNYDVAGYILGNGIMLDFSGKHWSGEHSPRGVWDSRQVDHRDIQEVLGNRGSNNGFNAMIDMIGNGNIRLMPEVGGINLAVKPNSTQMSQLRGYINHFKGEVEIDIDEVGGDTIHTFRYTRGTSSTKVLADIKAYFDEGIVPEQKTEGETDIRQFLYSDRVADKKTVDFLNEQLEKGEYDAKTNPDGGYYVTYKSMSFWGYDEDGNAILRSPMAEYVDGKLSGAYLIPKDKNKHIWYQATETIDETTGLPSGLLVKVKAPGKKNPNKLTDQYLPASENKHLIKDDWSNLYFNLKKKIFKNGKWEDSDVPARYNPYEHSSNSMLNDQFAVAYLRDNLVTVKMYVPVSEDNGTYRATWSKDPTGWTDWKTGVVAGKIGQQKDLKRRLYLSRYATPVEIVPDSEVAQAYKGYLEGTDVAIPDNVVPPNLLKELKKIGVPIEESGKIVNDDTKFSDRSPSSVSTRSLLANALETTAQNDIERTKLEQYKSKIDLIEAEYEKLSEIKKQANDIRFTKGRTSAETKKMKALEFEANQIANRINTYDRQLLNLESTTALKNVLQREKKLAYDKAKKEGKEALAKYREKAAQTQRELMNRHTESRKKAIDSRNRTEMRHKIRKVVDDLNNLLLNPTKDKHVPISLQKYVASALAVINMDTVGAEERIAKYNDLIAKSNNPDEIARLTKSRDNIESQGESLKDKLTTLQNAYAALLKSDDPLIKNAYDESIENLIANTIEKVGDTSLRNMSLEQLDAVYDMFKAIKATVRNANKMFKEGRQETITANSEWVKREISAVGGHHNRVLKATKFLKKFGWNMLKPIYAMKLIGSDIFTGLYENVRKGEDTWAVDVNEAKDFFRETAKKYNYKSWDFKKQYTFKDSAGHSFSLSIEQIMSLYAYSKREQADLHLENGGFIFDDSIEVVEKNKLGIPMKYEINDANPYRLKKDALENVISILDTDLKDVKGFVDEMQAYLSDVMGAKGNEVSLAMYDIKLYKEQNYFPLKTARYFREFDPEKNGTPKIKNSGFSKNTVPQAGNPIILSNFMDVWANHVNDMSMYHAFVLPLEDFMRVYNYSSTVGGYDSVQQYIKNAYGSQANTYIETLMNDLNGGARTDPAIDFIGKGMSLFKKAAVFSSASVVIQQPSAIARAFAYIDPKYFVDKPVPSKHSETWAEVKKYAPVAVIKEMGYFDTNMGRSTVDYITSQEYEGVKEKFKAVFADSNYRDEILSKAPALADELAWCAIWKAVKREIADSTNLQVGSEEFLNLAGKRFTEVVTKTQVYDSVLSRSALMRSKDTGAKMVTAFMAEPTTSLNMVVDALVEGKRGNKKFAGKAIGAVAASIILNSILVSLVSAARDDDDDETYIEKYLESLTTELIDGFNPLTYIPLIKDIWSIAQGYDVERADMSIWSDFFQSVENLFSDNKSGFEKVEGVVGAISSFFGLPLKNLMRDARAMYNLAETLLSGTPTTWAGVGDAIGGALKSSIPLYDRIEKWVGADESKSDKLYDAIISGDQNQIDRVKSQYKDDKAIESAIRQGLRENDPRIHEAAKARYEGDIEEYKRIAKEIIAEGNFSQDTVVAAINAEINAIEKGETSEEETTDETDKATSIYKASDINSAFESGDTDMALEVIDDLIKTKVANGMTEKEAKSSIRSSMTSYWKPLYKAAYKSGNTAEKERIERILKASGLYGNASEVIKTCREWRTERD